MTPLTCHDLAALLAAARETSAALHRVDDELALRLIHATINVTRHLSRDPSGR